MKTQTETYLEQKQRHAKEFNEFEGIFFAFSNDQLREGMEKIGLAHDDFKSIAKLGAGGFIKKDRVRAFTDMMVRQDVERKQLRQDEKALIDGLVYELGNHEYCITHDPSDAVERFGYTVDTIPQDTLKKAIKRYWELNPNN